MTTNDPRDVPPERAPETTSVFRADFLADVEQPAAEPAAAEPAERPGTRISPRELLVELGAIRHSQPGIQALHVGHHQIEHRGLIDGSLLTLFF